MTRQFLYVLLLTTVLWKPMLVLYVTSEQQPMYIMVFSFSQVFIKQADCHKFVKAKTKRTASLVGEEQDGVTIIGSTLYCAEDMSGVPT